MSALISVEGLSVRYAAGSHPTLQDVDLRIEPGELVLIAGPSGCGKSTLLRAVNGLVPHAYRAELTGRVTIEGTDSTAMSIREISRTVGTLLQNPAKQVVAQTVRADIAFGLENRGLPAHEILARVDEVAATLGIDAELLASATHELSGGQLQLIALAGILATRPRLIIVDEPLANLDPDAATRVLLALRDYVDAGGAALVVEHRVDDVLPIRPDRVVYLESGRVAYAGDVRGFLRTADPDSVKLPFSELISRSRALRPQRRHTPAHDGGSMLRYTRAGLGYGSTPVIDNVTADLRAGQRIAVLGHNGAGKSTLLRAAVGLVDVRSGSVDLQGRPVAGYRGPELARTAGYLFQNPAQALFAGTVADELAFGPRNLGVDPLDIERISADALAVVGLSGIPDILDRPPRTLSFGEQRRLALALALTLQPRVLILDEPTAGQDERSAAHFLDAIWSLPGIESIYFITHDVDLALWRSDRILVIDGGTILADGSPGDIVHDTTLWHTDSRPHGRAVLRETDYVRTVRGVTAAAEQIPSPHELARQLCPAITG